MAASAHSPAPLPFLQECRATLALALPLIAGQVGQMLMGVADTVMIGHVGVTELGAATFANTLLVVPLVFGMGMLSAVAVRVSQAHGGHRPADAAEAQRHGTVLALALGAFTLALVLLLLPWLDRMQQPPEVTARVPGFLLLCALSITPAMLSTCWKNHADALHHPWPPFLILLAGILLNILLNWLLIWGHGGFPALGLEGAGWATLTARTATAVAMILWLTRSPRIRDWMPKRWCLPLRMKTFRHLLAIGFPSSLQSLTEVGAFAGSALLIGTLGTVALAAHQITVTCAATTFMVPMGISMAVTVRIGKLAGAGQRAHLHRVLLSGWVFAVGFMSLSMLAFMTAGEFIAREFVQDAAVVAVTGQLLVVAGWFQLCDGLQVVAAGALRGVDDARFPAWTSLLAYWVIAMPAGSLLGLQMGHGAKGMWAGLALGVAVAALVLGSRSWLLLRPRKARAQGEP